MNTQVKQQILDKLKEYKRIMLFRHIRVDGDCVGATKGLKEIIRCTWPDKEVYLIDDEHSDYLAFLGPDDAAPEDSPYADDLYNDSLYEDALAVVIDVASAERISNQKFSLCREIIKIDHHIEREPYGTINWVEEDRSSACEMIADFYDTFRDELKINLAAATCIYTGMVTDSGRFMYEGVKGETLRLAGVMLDQGVDTERLYANLYLKDFTTLKFTAHVYEHMQMTPHGVAYILVDQQMRRQFSLTTEAASNVVGSLSGIRGCLCWIAFIEMPDGSIRVRLRSRFMTINTLAEAYNGGGHACASGATVYSMEEMNALLRDADDLIREYKETHEEWL